MVETRDFLVYKVGAYISSVANWRIVLTFGEFPCIGGKNISVLLTTLFITSIICSLPYHKVRHFSAITFVTKMATNEQKAKQLIAEAEKKVSAKGFFGSLFG